MKPGTMKGLLWIGLVIACCAGCDRFSNLSVNCQIGVQDNGQPTAGCEFANTGTEVTEGCVIVHVERPANTDQNREVETWKSEKVCSGHVQPCSGRRPGNSGRWEAQAYCEERTDPIQLDFGHGDNGLTVARACVEDNDGENHFICALRIEEVAN